MLDLIFEFIASLLLNFVYLVIAFPGNYIRWLIIFSRKMPYATFRRYDAKRNLLILDFCIGVLMILVLYLPLRSLWPHISLS